MQKIAPHNTKIFQWFNFFHGFQLYSPIAVIYFAAVTGSYAKAASLLSVAFIAQLLFEIPTGVISDSYGRKRAVTLGAISYMMAIAFYAIGANYWLLLVGAILEGLRGAFFSGNNDSLLYESGLQDGDEKYHHNMAKTETYFHLAATVSAIIGGLIAIASLKTVFLFTLLSALAMVVASLSVIEPKHEVSIKKKSLFHIAEAVRYIKKNNKLRVIGLASSIEFGFGHAAFGLQSAFVNTIWPIWAVGISRALSGLFATMSYALSGRIIDKFGPLKTVFVSGAWSRSLAFIGLVKPTIVSPALLSVTSLSFGSSTVAESTLLQQEFNSGQRATLGSITSVAGSFWFAVGSVTLGYFADKIGLQKAMLIGLIPLTLSTILYLRLVRR